LKTKELCEKYLEALNDGNLKNVLALFDESAIVKSPLYGEIPAKKFYTELFADTNRSDTKLLNIFNSNSRNNILALHFHYSWALRNREVVEFECVDVIEINPETSKIDTLKIIYDTAPLRDDFNKSKSEK
jgi:hypothetical protein